MFDKAVNGFKRWSWRKITLWIAVCILLAATLVWLLNRPASVVTNAGNHATSSALEFISSLNVTAAVPEEESRYSEGTQWFKAHEEQSMILWFDPKKGQIAVEDRRSGKLWSSNPGPEVLAQESTVGIWRSNLESPFIFNYFDDKKKNLLNSNTQEHPTTVEWAKIDQGVALCYKIDDLGFQIYVEYRLDKGQLTAHIPQLGIVETKTHLLTELDLLPFMGAAPNKSDGYLLVPDGPGGLIRFNKEGLELINSYSAPVYGLDWAVPSNTFFTRRTPISYPVFGINAGDGGYVAIIEEGAARANVVATPAGIVTPFNEAHAKFVLRRYYNQPSGLTTSKLGYDKKLPQEAISVRYIFLEQANADYVGMAEAYRGYLMEHRSIVRLDSGLERSPMQLQFVIGSSEASPLGEKLRMATTFAQVEEIVQRLAERGVTGIEVGLNGWQNGGDPGQLPKRFPVEADAGGEAGLRQLIAKLQLQGVKVSLSDRIDIASDSRKSGFSPSKDGIRAITGIPTTFTNPAGNTFSLISPIINLQKYMPKLVSEWKKLGIEGAHLVDLGNKLYSDFHPQHTLTRQDSMSVVGQMADTVRGALGNVKVSGGFDYLLGHVDHMFNFPLEYNFDLIIDEQVPFYPIAVHGLVAYSSAPANLREDQSMQFLRDIEYGAVPLFTLTHADPRILKKTSYSNLFSSQFDVLEEQILAEYEAQLATGVRNSFITGHRKLADGVYETEYESGQRVRVNYKDQPYRGDGFEIKPLYYQVSEKGGR
ncbi:DUF5696 domain-containing protein [Paenibacillus eucommiae]|uniref:Uncharacterized protein n=1 Tax=Paenibacillus eucommiae TaxID=1355755 RepID=A0ABS4IUN6_9BACL|nr:DUF5696 domain-containing protein [Paenibacillus eucommiae]MBP1990706.1 hypothetical protein [Paenibacillus eucommiae]